MQIHFFSNSFLQPRFIQLYLLYLLCGQIHTTSQSSPTQAYTQAISTIDKELEYLKQAIEIFWSLAVQTGLMRGAWNCKRTRRAAKLSDAGHHRWRSRSYCNLVHVYICNLDDSRCVMAYLSITPYIIIWCIAPCRNGVFDLLFGLLQLSLIYYNFKRPVWLVFLLNETLIVCSDTGVHHKWDMSWKLNSGNMVWRFCIIKFL